MSDPTTVNTMTNTTPNSCKVVQCDCNTMWSIVQQFSYTRLSNQTGDMKWKLVDNYAVRARRIAATYARLYLEQEEFSDPGKKGRFYWAALGAFASKTVACTLEAWQLSWSGAISKTTKDGLGRGNFWLFCDISGWHAYYCQYQKTFDMCIGTRNTENYVPTVKAQIKKLPWSAEALPKIKNLAASEHVKMGFAKCKEFEQESNPKKRPAIQLDHLMSIANHEQGVILQPLIYDDKNFDWWLGAQRNPVVKRMSPPLELVFSHMCSTTNSDHKSVAPDDFVMENFQSRMAWITKAADKFHGLMQKEAGYMQSELQAVAGWVGLV